MTETTNGPRVESGEATDRMAAFVRLAEHHLDKAYRLARAILRDPSEAQDATHDAILQAWRKWHTLRDTTLFERWFDRILIHTCRNRLQRASRWRTTDISHEVTLSMGDQFAPTHERDLLGSAIANLSPEHRVVVALRYYRDLTESDIAGYLEIPIGTVQSRLHYALKKLHAAITAAESRGNSR